ncbi:MAG: hypothetical protein SRB2_02844 [Desulfobacteraceae bacterium Eth-SRB2]|nr:MAG: hypothetical protein SRB2_02844 [Desulfobacteraceae bacterium Eth-SRB2]
MQRVSVPVASQRYSLGGLTAQLNGLVSQDTIKKNKRRNMLGKRKILHNMAENSL